MATEDLIGPLNDVEQQYAPPTLFVAGDLALLHHGARVAIVGSRQATPEGCARARKLASRLCDRGMVVVSGLAQGIDTAAHQAALDRGGRTPCASSLAICPVSMALSRDHLLHVGLIFRNELATCSAFSLLLTQQLGQSSPEVAQESL